MASIALKIRLVMASRISLSIPKMAGGFSASSVTVSIITPIRCGMSLQRARVRSTTSWTRLFKFTGTRVSCGSLKR